MKLELVQAGALELVQAGAHSMMRILPLVKNLPLVHRESQSNELSH